MSVNWRKLEVLFPSIQNTHEGASWQIRSETPIDIDEHLMCFQTGLGLDGLCWHNR
jgi:hypothetical protein